LRSSQRKEAKVEAFEKSEILPSLGRKRRSSGGAATAIRSARRDLDRRGDLRPGGATAGGNGDEDLGHSFGSGRVSRDYPHRELGHWRLEEEVIQLHEWRGGESSMLWGLADVISGYRYSRMVWGHRSRQADRWHLASRELVSGRVEKLVFKVARRGREVTKWREIWSRPSEEDRWQRSRDLANSGVRS
jgi:hypothetical protein